MPRCSCRLLIFFCFAAGGAGAQPDVPEKTPPATATPAAPPAAPGATPQADQSWQIHLDRPARPGQRYSLSSTGTQDRHTSTSSLGQPTETTTEHLEINYAAIHEIKAADQQGRPTEILIRLDRLTTNDGSGPIDQFQAGTVITAKANGNQTRYQLDRTELDGTLADALNLAGAKLPSTREPSEDTVFLNHTTRRPGDRWTADPKHLADAIAATTSFLIDPVTSTGEIHLDGPVTENGISALATTTTFRIAPIALSDAPDQTLAQSSISSTTVRIHPVDPALPLLKETLRTDMKIMRRAKSGPEPAGSETTFHREVTRRYLPLAADASK